jgi:hypothetical protein
MNTALTASRQGLLIMLPQSADFLTYLSDRALSDFTACRDAGWIAQEGGMFRRTEKGNAALKDAMKSQLNSPV